MTPSKERVIIRNNQVITREDKSLRIQLGNKEYRLLLLNSFSGYYNQKVYNYYKKFGIIIVFLPP
ncbi:hypothetical protein OFB79_25405, partial [Escherichia coli]|nr:hypothetical protein [Escherichia coli]